MTAYHNWTHRPRSRGGTDPLEFGGHGPWIEPTLLNGYSDTTAAPDTFAYRHAPGSPDDAWELEFRGHIEGPSDTYAFVLPEEDLPASDKYGITEGEDSDTGDGLVVEWYIEQATGFVFFTYPISGGSGGGGAVAAEDVSITDTGGYYSGTDVEAALQEIGAAGGGGAGTELDRVEFTSNTTASATTEATANTVVTATAIAFDGSTAVDIEFFAPIVRSGTGTNATLITLYDGSSSIGLMCQVRDGSASGGPVDAPLFGVRRLTPSNATHTYSARAWCPAGNGTVFGGSGGSGSFIPGYIRIVQA